MTRSGPTAPGATTTPRSGATDAGATGKSVRVTAIAFGKVLDSMRDQCTDKESFKRVYSDWKRVEHAAGRARTGGPSGVLFCLTRMSNTVRIKHGIPRVVVKGMRVFITPAIPAPDVHSSARRFEQNIEQLKKNKCGIEVGPVVFAGVIGIGSTDEQRVLVTNTSQQPCTLREVKLKFGSKGFALARIVEPTVLHPGSTWDTTVRAQPGEGGVLRDFLVFRFEQQGGKIFEIGHTLEARCGDAELLDLLKPNSTYVRPNRRLPPHRRKKGNEAVPAPTEPGVKPAPLLHPLKKYDLDDSGWRARLASGEAEELLQVGYAQLQSHTRDAGALRAYASHQTRLLFTEEVQLVEDLCSFDLVDERATTLTKRDARLWLKVPGLAEKRPSVLIGDKVIVRLVGGERRYMGSVVRIEQEEVELSLDQGFVRAYLTGKRVEVNFVLTRRPMRLFHQSLERIQLMGKPQKAFFEALLFPEPRDLVGGPPPRQVDGRARPFNRNLNEQQRGAVAAMVRASARRVPYVLFGPPGTGKTTTLVEAVLQCARFLQPAGPQSKLQPAGPQAKPFHILICASTNAAADCIGEKLSRVLAHNSELYRIVAHSRSVQEVPEGLRRFTNWNDRDGEFATPTLEEITRPIVVVATLTKAAELYNQGVECGHFDLIVIDEAGQAMEPEAVAPVAGLLGRNGQLVLAGDPKQLGPVIHHDLAKEYGLGTSYLERLMCRPVYQKRVGAGVGPLAYDADVLTKLVENYRSHVTLLELPSRLFYDGELLSRVDPIIANACLGWDGLPAKGVALLWHGIAGKEQREGNSPSWFNPDEVGQVLHYVRDLLQMRPALLPSQIGIISPYNKQVQKIKTALRASKINGASELKVGSTEMFQGQERRVIIISTVRSSSKWVDFDRAHNLGFLDNPKRFNVALTRAQSLLVIVGNPTVLCCDKCWDALLCLCMEKGAYHGLSVELESRKEAFSVEALVESLDNLGLNDEADAAASYSAPTDPADAAGAH